MEPQMSHTWGPPPDNPKPVTWCVQCSLKAFVNGDTQNLGLFNTTMDEHMRVFHPDPFEARREREELEAKARELLGIREFRIDEDR